MSMLRLSAAIPHAHQCHVKKNTHHKIVSQIQPNIAAEIPATRKNAENVLD